jgi:hypothetical protein
LWSAFASGHHAVNEDQRKPDAKNAHRERRQKKKVSHSFEHSASPGAVTARGGRFVFQYGRL